MTDDDVPRFDSELVSVEMVFPDGWFEDEEHVYDTPEQAALMQPMRIGEKPRIVSVETHDDSHADVEVDRGRHPADRIVYHCVREADGRWWAEGSEEWIDQVPKILAVARPSDTLGVFIHQYPGIDGYEVMTTGYDFASTRAAQVKTLDAAKARALKMTGRDQLDWQPWTPTSAE